MTDIDSSRKIKFNKSIYLKMHNKHEIMHTLKIIKAVGLDRFECFGEKP